MLCENLNQLIPLNQQQLKFKNSQISVLLILKTKQINR